MRWKSSSKAPAVFAILIATLAIAPGAWAAPKYKVLYNFQGGSDGIYPSAALVADSAGNLYGVTAGGGLGGNGGCGTVFELKRVKSGWAHQVLYRFPVGGNEGCYPYAPLMVDVTGNLYGTTEAGGQGDCFGRACGVVFELAPTTGGKWKQTVLYRFVGGNDGEIPSSGVVLDGAGNIYGTTQDGGGTCNCGTVYELIHTAGGSWNEQILYRFSGTDGAAPGGVIFDNAGNLYGLATTGGTYGEGVAFELSPTSGGGWNENPFYNFEGFADGAFPGFGLTFKGGSLYGATGLGGADGHGTIFELKPESNGNWTHKVLYNFTGGKDGFDPLSPFIFDRSGDFYGTTAGDVTCTKGNRWACGNVFELTPEAGGHWKLHVLHTFVGGSHGAFPSGPIFDRSANLFGVAYWGGNCKKGSGEYCGIAFALVP